MLTHLLSTEDYALALTPGFFRFYAHIGVLKALEECQCLQPSAIAGSSAGALVGTFLAAGMSPHEMAEAVFAVQRPDIWDIGGIGGLLKGELFEEILSRHLPVNTLSETKIPLCVTAFDMLRLRTTFMRSTLIGLEGEEATALTGLVTDQVKLSTAARASCTFPGLFQPVTINGTPHIDGGVWDHVGLMGLPHLLKDKTAFSKNDTNKKKLIVNVVFNNANKSVLPKELKGHRVSQLS